MRIRFPARSASLIGVCAVVAVGMAFILTVLLRQQTSSVVRSARQHAPENATPPLPANLPHLAPPTVIEEDMPDVFGVVEDDTGNPLQGARVRAILIASNICTDEVQEVSANETLRDGSYSMCMTSDFRLRWFTLTSIRGRLRNTQRSSINGQKN